MMRVKHFVVCLGRATIIILLFLNSTGCSARTEQVNAPTIPSDAPLPVFILGGWFSTDVKSSESDITDLQYKIMFETESQLKFTVLYPESGTEGYTFTYNFISENSIYVDNKRLIGGETWLLEKKGDNLVVHRYADNHETIIVLERVK